MHARQWKTARRLIKASYTLGLLFLLTGMILSFVARPAAAAGVMQVEATRPAGAPAPGAGPVQPPVERSGDRDTRVIPQDASRPNTQSRAAAAQEAAANPAPAVQEVTPSLSFTSSDTALCQFDPGWIDATLVVTLPEGMTARLQGSWYIVNPPDLRTDIVYLDGGTVTNGSTFTFAAYWPGVRPGDEVVEIHWGGALLNPTNGNPLDTASLDYFWYPHTCQRPEESPTPTVTATETTTSTATTTATPTDTSTPTVTPTGPTSTLATSTATATVTATDPSTPTRTSTQVIRRGTATPTQPNNQATGTVVVGGTNTVTPTFVGTLPTKQPPSVGGAPQVIPTTGADLTRPAAALDLFRKLSTNLGLLFLGVALVLQGFVRKSGG